MQFLQPASQCLRAQEMMSSQLQGSGLCLQQITTCSRFVWFCSCDQMVPFRTERSWDEKSAVLYVTLTWQCGVQGLHECERSLNKAVQMRLSHHTLRERSKLACTTLVVPWKHWLANETLKCHLMWGEVNLQEENSELMPRLTEISDRHGEVLVSSIT